MKPNKFIDPSVPLMEQRSTNLVEADVMTPEQIEEFNRPKHPVRVVQGGLVERLADGRVLVNRSTRSAVTAIRRYWNLKTVRPWHSGFLGGLVEAGTFVECHDSCDLHTLTVDGPEGPHCILLEEVRQ